jgi:L-asparaginase II
MANPVLVEVSRGALVESRHRGAVAVADANGDLVFALGDVERPTFPRSAIKAFQALPLVETGAADRFGFGDAELALAMASHMGEPLHVATATAMLAAAGLDGTCLRCGAQWPRRRTDQAALTLAGREPAAIHNNCSGKHAGFLCSAVAMGVDTAGYVDIDHPVMRGVTEAMAEMTGAAHEREAAGVDGCSIPTFAIPLHALARGFARFATGEGLSPARAAAAARLRKAAAAEPFMIAGTGGFCTRVMELLGSAAFVKYGAEGVYTAALPGRGLGVAIKMDDGAQRAVEVAIAAMLRVLLGIAEDDPRRSALDALAHPLILTRAGAACGEIRPAQDFLDAIAPLTA